MRNPPHPGKLPSTIIQAGPIAEVRPTSVIFQDGTVLDCDVILYCTGQYSFKNSISIPAMQ